MKVGRIEISESLFFSKLHQVDLSPLFSVFWPYRIEDKKLGVMTYIGISPHFDELQEGELIPTYIVTFRRVSDDPIKVVLESIKKRDEKR